MTPTGNEGKDLLQIAVYIFLAGGAWAMVKFLKETLTEIKGSVKELTAITAQHETRITVMESKGKRKTK